MSKVIWNTDEWHRLMNAAAPYVVMGWNTLDAVRRAQREIFANEPHRMRVLESITYLKHGMTLLNEAVTRLRATGAVHIHVPPPHGATVQAPPAGAAADADLPDWMKARIEAEAQAQAATIKARYDAALAARVRELLQHAPAAAAPSAAPDAAPPAPPQGSGSSGGTAAETKPAPSGENAKTTLTTLHCRVCKQAREHDEHGKCLHCRTRYRPELPQPDPRKPLPKVMLVGIWPMLRAHINEEFQDVLDLRFFDADVRDLKNIEAHAKKMDFVFSVHGIHGAIPSHLKQAAHHFEVLPGGATQALARLTTLAVNGK